MHDVASRFVADATKDLFGEPYQTSDGTTVVAVARASRWHSRTMVPVGIFVIREGEVAWQPAVDATRIALMGEAIGLAAAVIGTLAVLRRPPWPDLSERRHTSRQCD